MFAAIARALRFDVRRQPVARTRRRRSGQGYRFSPLFYVALVLGVVSSVSFMGVLLSVMAGG